MPSNKHILYTDLDAVLSQVADMTLVSIFQDLIRKPRDHFAAIKRRIRNDCATMICWRLLMFVAVAKTKAMIEKVARINQQYVEEIRRFICPATSKGMVKVLV
jgi:hypothetical protein